MIKKKQRPLVVANWKNHPKTLREAKKLFEGIKRRNARAQNASVVVCPPTLYLGKILADYQGSSILLGAQDVFWESKGSHTGMVTPALLRDNGVSHVIIGHSERRAAGETDEEVARKVSAARKAGLFVVLCVGERERDTDGVYLKTLREQIDASLKNVSRSAVARDFAVAYEPIWAIGKKSKDALDPRSVHQMTLFIKKTLARKYGRRCGMGVPVLYGGSVEVENAPALFADAGIGGVLVGHASLEPEAFAEIVRSAT